MRRRATVLLLCLVGMFLPTFPSQAHTELVSSNPVANSTIQNAPEAISLTFSEPPLAAGAYIDVQQPQGQTIASVTPIVSNKTLSVPWPSSIKPGTVAIIWRAVADDGHVSNGGFRFNYIQASTDQVVINKGSSNGRKTGAIIFLAFLLGSGFTLVVISRRNRRQ